MKRIGFASDAVPTARSTESRRCKATCSARARWPPIRAARARASRVAFDSIYLHNNGWGRHMGRVIVTVQGFSGTVSASVTFLAEQGGHAFAITRAIQYLAARQQVAIMMDCASAQRGEKPPSGEFGILA